MANRRTPELTPEPGQQLELAFAIFVGGDRGAEVPRVGQTIRADYAKVGQLEERTEVFADIAASRTVGKAHLEAHAARDDRDLLRSDDRPVVAGDLRQ